MRKINFLVGVLLFVIFSQNGLKAQKIDMNAPLPFDTSVSTGVLPNGLTYYVKHNSEPKNRAEMWMIVNAGSVLEDDDQQGLAHFCEHMAFNGTKNYPKHKLIEFLESIGMKFGADLNAYTSFDETVYTIEVPTDSAKFIDGGLLILYDWAHNVSYETEEVENERGVIHEEWRLGRGAQERMMRKTFPVLLAGSKYAKRNPIGKTEVFDKCPPDNLRRFYKDWYRPDLEAIVVVGDFDQKEMVKKIKELFSKIPARDVAKERKRIYPEIPNHVDPKVVIATDKEAPNSIIQIVYKHSLELFKTYGDYKKSLIEDLAQMMLNQRLREIAMKPKAPFAYGFAFYTHFLGKGNAFMSYAIAKNDKIAEGVKLLLEENERAKRFGYNQSELDLQKKSLLKSVEDAYKERNKRNSKSIANEFHANFSVEKAPVPGIEVEYEITKKMVPTITLDDVNKVIKKWITRENMVVVLQAPEKEDIKLPTEDEVKKIIADVEKEDLKPYEDQALNKPLIAEIPTAGKIKEKTKDKITGTETWVLENGVKIIFKPTDFKDDEIQMQAYSWGGISLYPVKDAFSARNAASILSQSGLGDFTNVELSKYLSDKTAYVTPFISTYTEGFNGSSSVDDFETMLQMVYLYFTKPRYDKEAFDTYIERTKSLIGNKSQDPQSVWGDTVSFVMKNYSPYHMPMNLDNLNKIDYKRVHAIFRERFEDPGSFTFCFVGNVNSKKLKKTILTYLGGLPANDNGEKYKALNDYIPTKRINKIVYKGTDNKSMAYVIYPGAYEPSLKNELLLQATADVLTDRLLKQIREKDANTYSISASPRESYLPKNQYFVGVWFSSAPNKVDTIISSINAIIKDLKTNGITDADLQKTIEKAKRSHEMNMRKNRYWMKELMTTDRFHFKPEFVTDFDKEIKGLTKASIQEAFKKYYDVDNFISVILKPVQEKK